MKPVVMGEQFHITIAARNCVNRIWAMLHCTIHLGLQNTPIAIFMSYPSQY